MTLQGGEKIAGKWAHLKAAEEGGRIRLDYECREERGDDEDEEGERTEGKQATVFHFAKANGPSFAGGNLRGERKVSPCKDML